MKKDIIFLPYYIDEGRLLDIYSIINQGYSEFDEVQLYSNIEKSKSAGLGLHFKVFKVGSENINKKNKHVSILSKKIQTLSSILNYVLSFFLEKNY